MTKIRMQEAAEAADPKLYELGFHLLPTFTEDEVIAEAQKISSLITSAGGNVVEIINPQMKALAYTIFTHEGGKNRPFETAYFATIAFEIASDKVEGLTKAVGGTHSVLRHLLITIPKEALEKEKASVKEEEAQEAAPAVSEAALDKTIADLVVE